MSKARIEVPHERIAAFCEKWKVAEFSLFGSVLTPDFDERASDVDVLVSFQPDAHWSLFDWVDMIDELRAIFGREVDLVDKDSVTNPYRRRSILANLEVVHAAS
jgi:uncharacterized protein